MSPYTPETSDNEPYMRYASNSFAWWIHDSIIHPFTGTLGLLGKLLKAPRLMALSHHLHNATAPSNDSWADYAEAAYRAGCNETANNPMGSMTPDEQEWVRKKYEEVTGKTPEKEPQFLAQELHRLGFPTWRTQAIGGRPPGPDAYIREATEAEERLGRILKALNSLGQHAIHQIRNDLIRDGKIKPEDWPK